MTKKESRRRMYVGYAQVLRLLGSKRPKSIVGRWYRGDTVRCSDCNRHAVEFTDVRSLGPCLSVRLHCPCGSVFEGSFGMLREPLPGYPQTYFRIDCWFSRAYINGLRDHCNRPEVKKALRTVHALMKEGSRPRG